MRLLQTYMGLADPIVRRKLTQIHSTRCVFGEVLGPEVRSAVHIVSATSPSQRQSLPAFFYFAYPLPQAFSLSVVAQLPTVFVICALRPLLGASNVQFLDLIPIECVDPLAVSCRATSVDLLLGGFLRELSLAMVWRSTERLRCSCDLPES